ncbi:helix-turn-helix transcriptional regulator [Butyrivibrio sp. LC3010]|uniref:helix-turn-helix transcriptional regulator n=1 Tax=Butyrivibrio sp. LC3010 TaxID=1280680 RepID=UPI00041B36C5|nr:helix-turn-helix transcriptional regulator [Butyrivibrio sp. LC3010]
MKDLSYSNKLYDLRKKNKLSQNKLADELGISRRTISMIENGEQNVSLDYAYRISAYFNLLVQEVFPVATEEAEATKTE